MLSTPELRQRATTVALCLLLVANHTAAQHYRRQQQPDTSSPVNARQIASQVLPSVVLITLTGGCYGSGFFITNDLIATNKHVLDCGGHGTVSVAGSRRTLPITASWSDPQHDLALVSVAGAKTKPLVLSTLGWPAVGDDIYVAGNPEGLEGTFSRGIVSGLRRNEGLIQFDASISPGSSGGPVVDRRGQVIGVAVASVKQGQNLNFAVPSQYLRALLERARRAAPDSPGVAGARRHPAPAITAPTNPANPLLRAWESNPDWGQYVSPVIGNTAVKDELKALLGAGLGANARDKRGRTALHMAAMLGQVELARYLVARGADINAIDSEGRTPLMIAVSLGGFDSFKGMTSQWERFWTEPLCRMDTDRTATRHDEELMQWYAMWQAERPMTLFLLGADADVNTVTREGRTALDYAAMGGLTDFDGLIRQTGRLRNESECALKLADAPVLRGFNLGMNLREVTARFRRFTMPETDACGRLNLDFNEARGSLSSLALRPREITGISRLRLTFVDERLAYIRVTYARESTVSNPQEFRASLSASLSLPDKWRATGGGDNWDHAHVIGCDGFKVMAGYLVGPYVEMHDVEALRKVLGRKTDEEAKRRREAEREQERRKREFKP
ncbi:MAG: trypsin-like peptidase domain-containing protein [Acidobacteria bacterium]|nr:trypsin-like peptidase domain-containing protein [Acidobacteriota bacterium]